MKSLLRLPAAALFAVGCALTALAQKPAEFPGYGIVPKEETGVARFLEQNPTYDGRGVVVAIFDTGVDPGAPGMQVTSDGKPKIVDVVDGSGSGDVDTSTIVEAEDGTLKGLTGRTLKLNPAWKNPRGKWHIGIKRAFELFPGELNSRLTEKRLKRWMEQQRAAVTAIERDLTAWEAEHPKPTDEQKKQKAELEARLEQLNALQENYEDPGPVFDCVVWNDGDVWRAAIDTDEDGDLTDEKAMTNFRLERQYSTFSQEDLMNYAVNIYNDGKLLSIVCDSGSHGTHVAGIVAAHFPDQPELNGVAPGAQIVSVKIGDTRIGSSSVGTGEVRGCVAVLQNNCDLINMSYGGPTADPDAGRLPEIYSEIVNKYNVIFVSSAGNEGPALTTAGGPGATTEAILGVGAYVSPAMMSVQYGMREQLPANQYTWSSRGPTTDGALGVKFSAPGGAIAPVPNWELQRNMLMNGTSMAAPNACGGMALLVSALKAQGLPHSPMRIRRALENTAIPVDGIEVFALGRGLIQIDKAYEYLLANQDRTDLDLRFDVRINARGGARGVYLREPYETDRPFESRITVTPRFHEDAPNPSKVDFELRCRLETTAPWVQCGENMLLMHNGRWIDIRVDPTDLEPGAHYAEIQGFDTTTPERGPVFRVPVTVVKPMPLPDDARHTWQKQLSLRTGMVDRTFIAVPDGATWADLRIRRLDAEEPRLVLVHAVQLLPGRHYAETEFQQYITIGPEADEVRSFAVVGGRTLELAFAQFWSSLGACELEYELTFHGLTPDDPRLFLDGGQVATPTGVTATLGVERLNPKGSFDALRQTIRPKSADIRPLDGQRDLLPEGLQTFELVLDYSLTLDEKAKITPRPALSEVPEFEDTWQSQMYMIFDAAKRWVTTGYADPGPVSLAKGEYTIRYHVRHDDPSKLEQLKDVPLYIDRALDKSIAVRFLADPDDYFTDGRFGARTLAPGARAMIWVAPPATDGLPKFAQPGDLLIGSIRYAGGDDKLPGEGERPGGYSVAFRVPPKPAKKDDAADAAGDDEKSAEARVADALLAARVAQLKTLRDPNDSALFDRLVEENLDQRADHLPTLLEVLRRADGPGRKDDLPAVVEAADRIIAAIDRDALAQHYGAKLDPDDKEAAKLRKEMDERKAALIEALHLRAKALHDIARESGGEAGPSDDETADSGPWADFDAAFRALAQWVDTAEGDYLPLHIDRLTSNARYGEALALLSKKIDETKPDKRLREQRRELFEKLGWVHWRDYESQWLLIRFPASFPPF